MAPCGLARRAGMASSKGLWRCGGNALALSFCRFKGFFNVLCLTAPQISSLMAVDQRLRRAFGIGVAAARILAKTSCDPTTTNEAQE